MAGIGFELKKLFNKKGLFHTVKAYLYSTIVTVGPFIMCTIMIVTMQVIMGWMGIDYLQKQLFLATVVYAFIFSQIITSGFSMMLTRFLADKLYKEEYEDILPSLYGIISLCLIIGGMIGILFFYYSSIGWLLALSSYLLFIQLIIMWLLTTYLSALKDYNKILLGYVWGIGAAILLSYILLSKSKLMPALSLIIGMDIGIFLTVTILMIYIRRYFSMNSHKHFLFLAYMDKYPSLFFINLFYTLGIYVHNFIFWRSSLNESVSGTYLFAPMYDVPTFYAYVSIIPTMVFFVVSMETTFYQKYRNYYALITQQGNLTEIENARKDMSRVLWSGLHNMMQLQLFFTIVALVLGNIFLPRIGLTALSLDIFNIIVLAANVSMAMLISILVLLYFEDRKGALIITTIFLISNVLLTLLTLRLGENYYGLGIFISAFLSASIALLRLRYFINNIHYHTFCSQPIIFKETKGVFTRLVKRLYGRN